ncbi:hypothetical protein [Streptomyces sp. NPDC001275]
MSAPQPRAAIDGAKPRIEYRQFQLVDQEDNLQLPHGWARSSRIVIPAGPGALLRTGGNDFYPLVRVEAWLAEPDPQDLWEAVEEADFRTGTGTVCLREWDGGPVEHPLSVGGPGSYRLRAYCRGRTEAEALVGHEFYYEGVEEWLLQVWAVSTGHCESVV